MGLKVLVRQSEDPKQQDENIKFSLRKLKKLCLKNGVLQTLRAKEYYEKPSEKKRRQKKRSIKESSRNKDQGSF